MWSFMWHSVFQGGRKINIYPPKMTKKQAGDKKDLGVTKKGMKEQTLEPPPLPPLDMSRMTSSPFLELESISSVNAK